MGYFSDVFDMFGMEDKAFQKVGNDKDSFKRMFWADIISSYIIGAFLFIFILFYFMIFVYAITQQEAGPFWLYVLLGFAGFIIAPFVFFGMNFICSWFIHLIGLIFGGKPRSYIDFFKVWRYPYAVFGKLFLLIPLIGAIAWGILNYFFLYKTYLNIHRMKKDRAIFATLVVLVIHIMLMCLYVFMIFFLPVLLAISH